MTEARNRPKKTIEERRDEAAKVGREAAKKKLKDRVQELRLLDDDNPHAQLQIEQWADSISFAIVRAYSTSVQRHIRGTKRSVVAALLTSVLRQRITPEIRDEVVSAYADLLITDKTLKAGQEAEIQNVFAEAVDVFLDEMFKGRWRK